MVERVTGSDRRRPEVWSEITKHIEPLSVSLQRLGFLPLESV
ncbi:MAG: hypothetical protein QNJ68_03015 [Microcoleaceae cyanobacterium MO_207.B10]|nr:hypothetical protein [Microcoleaceae cyanobacterium MO_207.B10]